MHPSFDSKPDVGFLDNVYSISSFTTSEDLNASIFGNEAFSKLLNIDPFDDLKISGEHLLSAIIDPLLE